MEYCNNYDFINYLLDEKIYDLLKSIPNLSLAKTGSGNISTANVPFTTFFASEINCVIVSARHSIQFRPLVLHNSTQRGQTQNCCSGKW